MILNCILLFISALLLAVHWILDFLFSGLTMEQIIFHLKYYIEGTDKIWGANLVYWSTTFKIYLLCMFLLFIFITVFIKIKKYYQSRFFCFSVFVVVLLISGCQYKSWDFLVARFSKSNFYENNYISPQKVNFNFPENKKNLIVIYWESIEETYKNKNIFSENLLPYMSNYSANQIGKYYQVYGSNWTVAGMVTSLCSVPLITPFRNNAYGGKSFLPRISCLPDILAKEGYSNYWLSTSFADFANMDVFFSNHSIPKENILDGKFFEADNLKRHSFGYYDNLMWQQLPNILGNRLKEPFFLIVNTIDTHMNLPLPDYCEKKYDDYRDVVICSDKQMNNFVQWFKHSKFADNTILLIIGDHLAMDKGFINNFMAKHLKERSIFNVLLGTEFIFDKNRKFSALDIMPTLLQILGVKWGDIRLGLGSSLLSNDDNLFEKYGEDELNKNLVKYNSFFVYKDDEI